MVRSVFLRAAHNYDVDAVSRQVGIVFDPDEGMTQQQFKDECDINTIVERFGLTGELPENIRMPVSGDFTQVTDFQSAMNMVRQAEEAFNELPGAVRYRFANNPARLIEFLEDGDNRAEAIKLGLVPPPPATVVSDGKTPDPKPDPVTTAT